MIRIKIHKKPIENRTILNNRTIEIKEGSFNIITGPSGVGKSSLLNIIGLLDNAFVGEYEFFGKKVEMKDNNITTYIRRKYFGFIFQDSLINVKQNVTRNILCSVDAQNIITARERINDILVSVGLSNINDNVSFLSGGEKQRLALARALIKSPSILLADEPTASLDIKNKKLVMNILSEYNKLGGTVVMVTHDLELIDDNMTLIQLLNT
ncbi:TPA: dispersin export ABC transporter ATP-binding protein AatC [Escherichia coli]|uniref:dispersin export ABC transporter ATP-binding protein AatC n=1 Tax=Escherichia coli TaxID=562 RepID=UPI000510BD33|nr:dispersin export ABC transporter ATP-binding protein AatC [Escherichia coli]EFW6871404.1 dispersin export ABC transporter ATP-binding protein AatC [Shigella sonnei]EEY6225155.1 dispersin export ABC transporter ATP-binding protein AatC [Escherichia coli]EFB1429349.1 dispersin export ABC transporter ATP-binding protein AatC [Escherichia coli]EFC4117286.1 dispersin export ABC transporter ATP-binding protein AatC [Escherichia coli]EFG4207860.1 dispersin export ABC transporter ATP-binding protei